MSAFSFTAFSSLAFSTDAVAVPTPGFNVPDHVLEAISRLPQQFRKPKIEALLAALVRPAQAIESAAWQLLTQRLITTALGIELDAIGAIVGQARDGLDDPTYRRYIQTRITALRSRGTTEDLIRILKLLVSDDAAVYQVLGGGVAAIEVRIATIAVSDALADTILAFLALAVSAGARVILETSTVAPARRFKLDTPGQGYDDPTITYSDARTP